MLLVQYSLFNNQNILKILLINIFFYKLISGNYIYLLMLNCIYCFFIDAIYFAKSITVIETNSIMLIMML